MRTPAATHHQAEHTEADRRTAAASSRDSFSEAGNRYSGQDDKRTGRVDGLLRAHAALVHEIE